VAGRGTAGYLVIKISGYVVLQEFPEILDDQLGGACILVLLEPLVDTDDVHELVGQVILGPLAVLQDDGWPHGDRRNGEYREDGPFRTQE
jgi:hypothetical protein